MIDHRLRASAAALVSAALALASTTSAAQLTPAPAPARTDAQTEEIVVTAQRSGIPVWRVVGPTTTIVLVGSIRAVAAGTRWDPVPLEAALTQADRVMFPESMSIGLGLFSAIGTLSKWRKQATLPEGQTLQAFTTPAQYARLVALRDKGILKPGFERKHPYHIAMTLDRVSRGKPNLAPNADAYVRRFLGKNKEKRVPLAQGDFKSFMSEFFDMSPRAHVPCLMAAVAKAEAGPAGAEARADAIKARSEAWAARRVPEALAASKGEEERFCWPAGGRFETARQQAVSPTVRGLLNKPQVTLAVMSLDTLAKPGGVLDDLVAAGFDVRGPQWKR